MNKYLQYFRGGGAVFSNHIVAACDIFFVHILK